MKKYIAIILVLLFAGCAHEQVNVGSRHITGLRNDLSNVSAEGVKALAQSYVRAGNVFLYASQYTDSPVVDKDEVPFAVQFKTTPIYGGFQNAALFNRYMLEYIRGQLRFNLCPEHHGVPLQGKIVKKKQRVIVEQPQTRISKREKRHASTSVKTVIVKENVLVCPADGRIFIPDNLTKNAPIEKAQKTSTVVAP
jgi:hypothetical protein